MNKINLLTELFYEKTGDAQSGMLIVSPENRKYLTGFPSSDGFLAICRDSAEFFTDSRYIEAAAQTVTVCPCTEQKNIEEQLRSFFWQQGVRTVAVESERLTVRQYENLKKGLGDIAVLADGTLDHCIAALRCVKDEAELSEIVGAQRIAEKAFLHILDFIRPGMSEKQIALELDYFMLSCGADALSFETIAVSGANTSKPHGVPSEKKVEKGDFITMDFGAVVNGYHSDMTRTVALGAVSAKQKRVYETVVRAKNTAESVIRAGLAAADADRAARDVIEKEGFGEFFRHGTGHGVGVEIHELPNLSPKSKAVLQRGNIVTVEPGIYLPAEFGVRVEDMVFVEENGCRKLTEAEEKLLIL